MEPRVSLITLGVGDVARARAFYQALGFTLSSASQDEVAFFDLGGVVLAVWSRTALAADVGLPLAEGFGGVALAHNVHSPVEVDGVLARAVSAGATLLRPGHKTAWGGYSGYFADPDGHPWEVAHNPFWNLDAHGRLWSDG